MQHHISSFIRLSYRSIPNLLTLLNLVSGSIGVILVFQGRLVEGALLVRVGALFDFLDGFVARGLRLYSPLGKQLDSLADLITFGFLPTVIMYTLLEQQSDVLWEPYLTLSIVVCSAFRLAKFNISTNQQDRFVGLSTTALGIFISTLPAIIANHHFPIVTQVLTAPGTLVALSCIGAMLLVSNIPFMALKFHGYSWRRNRIRYICCGVAVTCMAVGGVEGIGFILLLYIVFGNLLQRCISNEKR
jgi:CDP-diacylglycerol--serine O-phosphatidyltransferase